MIMDRFPLLLTYKSLARRLESRELAFDILQLLLSSVPVFRNCPTCSKSPPENVSLTNVKPGSIMLAERIVLFVLFIIGSELLRAETISVGTWLGILRKMGLWSLFIPVMFGMLLRKFPHWIILDRRRRPLYPTLNSLTIPPHFFWMGVSSMILYSAMVTSGKDRTTFIMVLCLLLLVAFAFDYLGKRWIGSYDLWLDHLTFLSQKVEDGRFRDWMKQVFLLKDVPRYIHGIEEPFMDEDELEVVFSAWINLHYSSPPCFN